MDAPVAITTMVELLVMETAEFVPQPTNDPTSPNAQRQRRSRMSLLLRKPKNPTRNPMEPPKAAARFPSDCSRAGSFFAVLADTETVMVVLAPATPGVMLEGEKLAVAPLGNPDTLKITGELNGLAVEDDVN
jgi:hypothetical protein